MFDFGDGVLISSRFRDVGPMSQTAVAPTTVGEKRDFGREITEAKRVIEVEVLKFIGTNHLRGFLRRLLPVGVAGNKLRANFRVDDGTKHHASLFAQLVRVGDPPDEKLDERFRYAGVNAVVGHVVTDTVGAPAEGKLAEITGPHDQGLIKIGKP